MDNRSDIKEHLDPVTAAKRARQEEARRLVESGERSLESMFFISPEIARTIQLRRRTEDF
ncbi:hypothetical protein [Paraburkholderia sacchari]|uniref:hypothetical protein n=1 Tax=Paraburkholderia sacchari TaxID=159450 RepID=UPI003D99FEF7